MGGEFVVVVGFFVWMVGWFLLVFFLNSAETAFGVATFDAQKMSEVKE